MSDPSPSESNTTETPSQTGSFIMDRNASEEQVENPPVQAPTVASFASTTSESANATAPQPAPAPSPPGPLAAPPATVYSTSVTPGSQATNLPSSAPTAISSAAAPPQPAPAPASIGPPVTTPDASQSGSGAPSRERFNVRITHPQFSGTANQPRVVHVDRTTGQVRLDLGSGNVVTVPLQYQPGQNHQARVIVNQVPGPAPPAANSPTTTGIPSNVNIRVAHLYPLRPQPIQEIGHVPPNSENESFNEEAQARFKCSLCYEFMKDPVGCPSETCSARFCHACLHRAAHESQQASVTPYTANQKPKCPTCRVGFAHIVHDERLKHEMYNEPTVACRHEGCPERHLSLPNVQDHEQNCAYEKVRCRYQSFGCPWVGTRGQVLDHEVNDCALEKVKVLVDKFRRMEMDFTNRLSILQQQNHGSMHMLQVYRQNAQRDLLKSTSNLVDLLHYCHAVTCATNHFLQTKERWNSFYRSNEGRAAVTNFLVLLPSVMICGNLSLWGVQSLLQFCFDERNEQLSSIASRALDFLLGDSVVGILLGMLTSLLLLVNAVDTKSSVAWGHFPLPGMGNPPVMRDIMAVSIFTMHVGVMELFGAASKSLVVWLFLALASTVYPAMVLSMSHGAARGLTSTPAPTISNSLGNVRSLEPTLFGLRFCLVGTLFGILPTLDAAAMVILIQPALRPHDGESHRQWWFFSMLSTTKNCFLDTLPRSFWVAYLGSKTAMLAVSFQQWKNGVHWKKVMSSAMGDESSLLWSLVNSALAFFVLLVTTALLNALLELGLQVGQTVLNQAESAVSLQTRPDGSSPLTHDYQLLGLASFGVWCGLLGILLRVR